MAKKPENVPIDELRKLAEVALIDNMNIMVALSDYDNRDEGVTTAQPIGHYFTLKRGTGTIKSYVTDSVKVFRNSVTQPTKTEFVKAE